MLITMQLSLSLFAVVVANVLGSVMALPQAARLLRLRRTDGVSPAWAAMSATINAGWVVYAVGVREWPIIPAGAVSVGAYLVIAYCLVRYSTRSAWSVVGSMLGVTVALSLVPLAAYLVSGWAALGVALGALYGVQLSPAVVTVYRALDVSGVSTATWMIAWAEAVLWGVYGFPRADAGLIALAATGTFMSTLVLLRLFLRRPPRVRSTRLAFAPAG